MRTQTIKLGVQVSINDVMTAVSSFNLNQKRALYNKLRMEFFKEGFEKLSKEITTPGFSDDEIMAEVKTVRKQKS